MSNRTLLVDSDYLFKRSFNGAKDVHTNKFGHIGGLYSTLTTIRMLIKQHKINKVILFWDGEGGGKFRHNIDPAYKANRKNKEWSKKIELTEAEIKREQEKDVSILKQKKRINAYAEELFLRQICVDDVEADDLIAQYCYDHHLTEDLIIFTNDRDYLQLLNLNLTIIFGNIEQPITKSNFFFHFNYHHSNALLMKVICGDTADNIVGVGGVKDDGLIKLFPDLKFKTLMVRDICKMADDINKDRVAHKKKPLIALENIVNNVPRLIMNYEMINLAKPFLTEAAIEELEQLEMPLAPEGRGSKNLYKYMIEDEFLSIYGSSFTSYVEPFYTVIMHEKQIYDNYMKNV